MIVFSYFHNLSKQMILEGKNPQRNVRKSYIKDSPLGLKPAK